MPHEQRERDIATLADILASAELPMRRVEGRSLEEFRQSVDLQDLVIFRLLVIGEAARRLSDHAAKRCSTVPWEKVRGMRNHLIHGYDIVDLEIVWDTVRTHIKPLADAIRNAQS